MSCSYVSGPPRTKSPFFVIEVGAHHIYDDTGFCHNYRHRSDISRTIFFHSAQNVTDVSFFVVTRLTYVHQQLKLSKIDN